MRLLREPAGAPYNPKFWTMTIFSLCAFTGCIYFDGEWHPNEFSKTSFCVDFFSLVWIRATEFSWSLETFFWFGNAVVFLHACGCSAKVFLCHQGGPRSCRMAGLSIYGHCMQLQKWLPTCYTSIAQCLSALNRP